MSEEPIAVSIYAKCYYYLVLYTTSMQRVSFLFSALYAKVSWLIRASYIIWCEDIPVWWFWRGLGYTRTRLWSGWRCDLPARNDGNQVLRLSDLIASVTKIRVRLVSTYSYAYSHRSNYRSYTLFCVLLHQYSHLTSFNPNQGTRIFTALDSW